MKWAKNSAHDTFFQLLSVTTLLVTFLVAKLYSITNFVRLSFRPFYGCYAVYLAAIRGRKLIFRDDYPKKDNVNILQTHIVCRYVGNALANICFWLLLKWFSGTMSIFCLFSFLKNILAPLPLRKYTLNYVFIRFIQQLFLLHEMKLEQSFSIAFPIWMDVWMGEHLIFTWNWAETRNKTTDFSFKVW